MLIVYVLKNLLKAIERVAYSMFVNITRDSILEFVLDYGMVFFLVLVVNKGVGPFAFYDVIDPCYHVYFIIFLI